MIYDMIGQLYIHIYIYDGHWKETKIGNDKKSHDLRFSLKNAFWFFNDIFFWIITCKIVQRKNLIMKCIFLFVIEDVIYDYIY